MTADELRQTLEQVRSGRLPVADALSRIHPPVADLGFANVDLDRRARCGFPEVVFCEGKTAEWVEGVVARLVAAGQDCLATRVSPQQADHLARVFPQAELMANVKKLAERIAANGPLAVAECKRLIQQGQSTTLEHALALEQRSFGLLFATSDQREGMGAFLAKRPAQFKGQ